MPFKSAHPDLDIPQTDLLSYLFGKEQPSDEPLWYNSEDLTKNLSPRQALEWIKRLGYGLNRMGLKRGDVVLTFTPNHIFVPVAYLGVVGAGCVFSGANPIYNAQEFAHQLSNSTAKVVLAHPQGLDCVVEAADKIGFPRECIFQFSDQFNATQNGVRDWSAMLGSVEESRTWQWHVMNPKEARETVATINYSSGTTGLPKGVCVSHGNIIANLEQNYFMRYIGTPYEKGGQPPRERCIGFLPLYHAYGQLYSILLACKLRHTVYVMPGFDFLKFLGLIATHKVTTIQVVPPIIIMLTKRPETSQYDLSSLEEVRCGAAPLSRELQAECKKMFGVKVAQGWGMTEVTCAGLLPPQSLEDAKGSVGTVLPNCECKLVDDEGREVREHGELLIKGPQVCLGYWRNEKATKELIEDGWLKTGDIAVRDKDGLFWIVDRKKELIKVNGLQVAPAELEAVLLENEHVADAAVVGITVRDVESPRAYVVLQPKAKVQPADIQTWIASRVAKHKRLLGGVVFVDEIPKLASGKIQRKVMRDWAKRDATELEKSSGKTAAKL